MKIIKELVVSARHIPKGLLPWGDPSLEGDRGWLLYTSFLDDGHLIVPELARLLRFAKENGCERLRIETNGPEVEGLEKFDWD